MVAIIIACFVVPTVSFFFIAHKGKKYLLSFLTGCLVFAVSQLAIRVPVIQYVLPSQSWFLKMQLVSPVLNALFFAVTAGLFEETGRYIGLRIFRKKRVSWLDGVAFGLGHGGIEALWIGVTMLAYSGAPSQGNYAVVAFERICAIIIHIGMTLVVLKGIEKKKIRYLFFAILMHTLVNLPAGIGFSVVLTEGYVCLWAVVMTIYIVNDRKRERIEL